MSDRSISFEGSGKALLWSAAVFVVLAAIVHFAVATERERLEQNLRTQVERQILGVVARLEAELNADVFLANGLVAHATAAHPPDDTEMLTALKTLFRYGRHIRNIGIAPGNRLSHIYPLEGNRGALGLYYPELPDQWPAVKRAMDHRTTVLAGPVELRQGGRGLISRTPVFLEDGTYWGIVSLVLDADALFESVNLEPEFDGIRVALRGADGLGEKGGVFMGDPALFDSDSVRVSLNVPDGSWVVAAAPSRGWQAGSKYLVWLYFGTLGVCLLLAGVSFAYQRGRLRINASERRLRTFLQATYDGVIVIDDRGMIEEFNPAAKRLFGFGDDDVIGASVNMLMPHTEAVRHDTYIRDSWKSATRRMAAEREVVGRRKDGGEFPIEVSISGTEIAGRRIHVGVIRDITERKAFERKLKELANTDGLTGALNRRAFIETAEQTFGLARRHDRPLSVLMIDADHFKAVNDTHGHQIGDKVLVRLSAIVRESLRKTDRFGRFGGEEFMVLLPETGADAAFDAAERLLTAMREAEVPADGDASVKFTVSIGVATRIPSMPDLDALIQDADKALYRAKEEGRNRAAR